MALFFGNIKQKDVLTASTKKAFMQAAEGFYVYLGVAELRYDNGGQRMFWLPHLPRFLSNWKDALDREPEHLIT